MTASFAPRAKGLTSSYVVPTDGKSTKAPNATGPLSHWHEARPSRHRSDSQFCIMDKETSIDRALGTGEYTDEADEQRRGMQGRGHGKDVEGSRTAPRSWRASSAVVPECRLRLSSRSLPMHRIRDRTAQFELIQNFKIPLRSKQTEQW